MTVAAALALAATGGRDHWHYSDPLVLGSDRWGLWALPAGAFTSLAPEGYYDPAAGALALARLWQQYDGWGDWHPDYGPGGHGQYLDLAAAQLAAEGHYGATGSDLHFADMLDRIMGRARAQRSRIGG